MASLLAMPSRAQELTYDVGVVARLASDTVYHGTTETFGEPSIGLDLQWQPTGGVVLGLEAHAATVGAVRQRHSSVSAYLGYGRAFADRWFIDGAIARREFPSSPKPWQYTEVKAQLSHERGFSLSLDYAPDYYAHNTEAFALELNQRAFFRPGWFYHASVGAVELSNERFTDYHYASVGGGFARGRYSLDLSYGWNSEDGVDQFGPEPLRSPE
ncbi:MAG: hypothetical protein AAFU65_17700, partial [Pseudomonadota bacterium]